LLWPVVPSGYADDLAQRILSDHRSDMSLKILLTGATGYVGRFLIEALPSEGELFAVGRSTSPWALDVSDADACRALLQELKPDVIVHAGALSSPAECEKNPERAWKTNACKGFLEAAVIANPSVRFVFLSTDQVLGGSGHLVDEKEPGAPVNVYGETKFAMEAAVQEVFPERHAILRLSFVFGPVQEGAHTTFLQFALDKLRSGQAFDAFEDQVRSAVFINDVVESVQLGVRGTLHGCTNIGGPEPLSRLDFVRVVAETCGFRSDQVSASRFGDKASMVPSPSDISMDVGKLSRLLGRHPLSLAEALGQMGLSASPRSGM